MAREGAHLGPARRLRPTTFSVLLPSSRFPNGWALKNFFE